jgi:hypothetical protein
MSHVIRPVVQVLAVVEEDEKDDWEGEKRYED